MDQPNGLGFWHSHGARKARAARTLNDDQETSRGPSSCVTLPAPLTTLLPFVNHPQDLGGSFPSSTTTSTSSTRAGERQSSCICHSKMTEAPRAGVCIAQSGAGSGNASNATLHQHRVACVLNLSQLRDQHTSEGYGAGPCDCGACLASNVPPSFCCVPLTQAGPAP